MPGEERLSWKEQLVRVRERVVDMERRRAEEKRLQRERNEQSLRRRLKEDTPEALNVRFSELRRRFDKAARKFFPLPHIEQAAEQIKEFAGLLEFYADCMKGFPRVFSNRHRTAIHSILAEMDTVRRGLDRQIKQWRGVREVLREVRFRPRTPEDDRVLVAVAKAFSERAHRVPLSIPSDFFVHEGENFWVVEFGGRVLGYVKYWPAGRFLTLALDAPEGVNFGKFVRGVLYRFCSEGVGGERMDVVRVRVGFVREVRFFTDMGFVRGETRGPSDWIYQRALE